MNESEQQKHDSKQERKRFGDLLIEKGYLDKVLLEEMLQESVLKNRPLGQILVEHLIIDENTILEALHEQTGFPIANLETIRKKIKPIMAWHKKYDPDFAYAKRHNVFFYIEDKTLYAFFCYVDRDLLLSETSIIADISGCNSVQISIMSNEHMRLVLAEIMDILLMEATAKPEKFTGIEELLHNILGKAVTMNASDIHFDMDEEHGMVVRYRLEGKLFEVHRFLGHVGDRLLNALKTRSGMNISERAMPQEGRLILPLHEENRKVEMRLSCLPTIMGESLVVRIMDTLRKESLASWNAIGFAPSFQPLLRKVLTDSHGMLVISGPTGSGKTTTSYALLRELISPGKSLVSVEDPVEMILPHARQVQIDEKRINFSNALRNVLRQDPEIIFVGEIRDRDTAILACNAAITGHLVISTIHTYSAPAVLDRLLDLGVPRYMISNGIRGVLAQRLVPKICPTCARDDNETAKMLGFKTGKVNGNCRDCMFKAGRRPVFEGFFPDQDIRDMYLDQKKLSEIVVKAEAEGKYHPFREHLKYLIENGEIPLTCNISL